MRHTLMFKVSIIMLIISILLLPIAGILFGCASMISPFNIIPLAVIILFLGIVGIITFSALTSITLEDRRY